MNKSKPIQDIFYVSMKVSAIQLLMMIMMTTLVSAATLNGQTLLDRQVTLSVENKKVKFILKELEKQADTNFTYRPEDIDEWKSVSLSTFSGSLSEALNQLFNHSLEYYVIENEIILTPKKPEATPSASAEVNAVRVEGIVVDETGAALPGV